MAPHERAIKQSFLRQLLISLGLIVAGIVMFIVVTFVALDVYCAADINHQMPIYPNGEVVSVEHTYFRPRGIGTTNMIMQTDDSRGEIIRWYVDHSREAGRSPGYAITSSPPGIQENDDGSSTIVLFSRCAFQ